MNDTEIVECHVENAQELKKKQIDMYKTMLKYYQARSLSLDVIVASKQVTVNVPDEMKTCSILNQNTRELHDGTIMLESIKKCVQIIKNTLTYSQIMGSDNFEFKQKILDMIQGIIYFSKSIMKLYQERVSALDLIKEKKAYCVALENINQHFDMLKKNKHEFAQEDSGTLQKVELQVYKINLIRAIKAILLGYISANHPQIIKKFEHLITSLGRNLTMEDFIETWNIDLPS